jgi:hypothetical protein
MSDSVEAAWNALYDSLPPRWHVGRPAYDPERGAWAVTAWGPPRGRAKAPQGVTGIGNDASAALADLDARLRCLPGSHNARKEELRRTVMLAYIEGAEACSREQSGRALTVGEFTRVLMEFEPRL